MSLKPAANPSPSSLPTPGFQAGSSYRRRTLIQILTDYADQFGPTNLEHERGGGIIEGHANLTSEQINRIEGRGDYYDSHRAVAQALDGMKIEDGNGYSAIRRTFLNPDTGHTEIRNTLAHMEEQLAAKDQLMDELRTMKSEGMSKENLETYFLNHYTPEMAFASHLDAGLAELESRLEDVELYAAFPTDLAHAPAKTDRRKITEEHYNDLYAAFSDHCKKIQAERGDDKPYRNRAMDLTSHTMAVSKPTVERAVRWIERDV